MTNKKKLKEWSDICLGNFNACLGDFLVQEICQQDWRRC